MAAGSVLWILAMLDRTPKAADAGDTCSILATHTDNPLSGHDYFGVKRYAKVVDWCEMIWES